MPRPKLPSADEIAEIPVRTESEILERVTAIVQQALRRELWFFLFDPGGRQLPVLVPMDIPVRPERGRRVGFDPVAAIARLLDELVEVEEAAEVVIVYERPGSAALRPEDSAWFEFLARVEEQAEARIRSVVFVGGRRFRVIHARGVEGSAA